MTHYKTWYGAKLRGNSHVSNEAYFLEKAKHSCSAITLQCSSPSGGASSHSIARGLPAVKFYVLYCGKPSFFCQFGNSVRKNRPSQRTMRQSK